MGALLAVITQNIDSLHQRAGSQRVISIHGDYWNSHCLECGREFDLDTMATRCARRPFRTAHAMGSSNLTWCFSGRLFGTSKKPPARFSPATFFWFSARRWHPAAFLPQQAGGDVVVVNQGEVGLLPGPGRHFVDADLDQYFAEVAEHLGVKI